MAKILRIVLVSPGQLTTNPRLVKEAAALSEEGHDVTVISCMYEAFANDCDYAIAKSSSWKWTPIKWQTGRFWQLIHRCKQEAAKRLFFLGLTSPSIAVAAHHPLAAELRRIAVCTIADLYIGHHLASLPAVTCAALENGAVAGFDAEDFHSGECADTPSGRFVNRIAATIENAYIPLVDHITAASPLIANEYSRIAKSRPIEILNTFPCQAIEVKREPEEQSSQQQTFYWFSQTVGRGRGLEQFIVIAGRMSIKVVICLRGNVSLSYKNELLEVACKAGVTIEFLPFGKPNDMVMLAQGYTAGLALETGFSKNNDIALSNKIFTYVAAGIPVVLSSTSAQTLIARDLGDAAILIDLNNPEYSAEKLSNWTSEDGQLKIAKASVRDLASSRYNWLSEKCTLVKAVNRFESLG